MAHGENVLRAGEKLEPGQYLRSKKNGLFHAVMQEDSNFVVYRGDWEKTARETHQNTCLWSYITHVFDWKRQTEKRCTAIMQTDGNFVVYAEGGHAVWATDTWVEEKSSGHYAQLEDTGNFAVRSGGNKFDTNVRDRIKDPEGEKQIVEVNYDFTQVKVTELGEPGRSMGNTARNDTDTEQSATLTLTYAKTTSHTFDFTLGFKLSATAGGKIGVPFVAEGEVSTTFEASTNFKWSDTKASTETVKVDLPVKVPPGEKIIGRCVWHTSKISVPFKLVYITKFEGYPHDVYCHSDGQYSGINTHDIEVSWTNANKNINDAMNWVRVELSDLPLTVEPA